MAWQLLTLTVDQPQADALSEALTEAGALSVTLEDAEDEPIFELPPDTVIFWTRCKITGLFEEGIALTPLVLALEHQLNAPIESQITALPDEDWERVCLDQFQPMSFGERLWICPTWHTLPPGAGIVVTLDPGLAFGTGSHPTTRLILQWLDQADLTGKVVIDYGCGSGILAIAAAKLGAARVIAVDYDPQALVATANNAAENHCEHLIQAVLPKDCPEIKADIILANIIVNPLIELMPVFISHLQPGGDLILSGLLQDQESLLLTQVPSALQHVKTVQVEEWLRVDLRLK
jgi:ribosomal protein L11 methyltransferase